MIKWALNLLTAIGYFAVAGIAITYFFINEKFEWIPETALELVREKELLERPDAKSCSECHEGIYKAWKESRHSVSWISKTYVEASENHSKEKCLACHIPESVMRNRPIMLHRALMGSLERFFGCLVEHYAGAFPLWLAPVQVVLCTITDSQIKYAEKLAQRFEESDIRVEKDLRNEKIGFKIREAQLQKIPYMIVLGDKEVETSTLSVRRRRSKETRTLDLKTFLNEVNESVKNRTIDTEG